mgnify:CR=1 FL=1
MTPIPDTERKRDLLNVWLALHAPDRTVHLLPEGVSFSYEKAMEQIYEHVMCREVSEEVIYILIAATADGEVPVYVGRSRDVCSRWSTHLVGIGSGDGVYATWQSMLLTDSMKTRWSLSLMVVPGSQIEFPPIPGFPTTIGAVEYQLVSLMADAYPSMTLNHEGRLR